MKRHRIVAAAVLALGAAAASAGDDARLRAADPAELSYTYAVGAFAPEYTPPAPGSYTLPPIDTVTDHALLGADGRPTTLFALTQGRLAVVAFVYTTCIEATGCPLSLAVLHRLDRAIAADAELARRVVLVTISFDPERDTPARMAVMRSFHAPASEAPGPATHATAAQRATATTIPERRTPMACSSLPCPFLTQGAPMSLDDSVVGDCVRCRRENSCRSPTSPLATRGPRSGLCVIDK